MPSSNIIAVAAISDDAMPARSTGRVRNLSTGAIAGIVVGAVCILALLLALLWLKRRRSGGDQCHVDLQPPIDEVPGFGEHGEPQVVSPKMISCSVFYQLLAKHSHSDLRQVDGALHELPPDGAK
jgi:hypothetical protein